MHTLRTNMLSEADYVRQRLHIGTAEGATLDDLMRPAFWAHVAAQMRPGALIDVVDPAGSYDATLRVTETGEGWAKVRMLRLWTAEPAAAEEDHGARVEWGGPRHKWRVVRGSDNAAIHIGCATEDEASKWLAENQDKV